MSHQMPRAKVPNPNPAQSSHQRQLAWAYWARTVTPTIIVFAGFSAGNVRNVKLGIYHLVIRNGINVPPRHGQTVAVAQACMLVVGMFVVRPPSHHCLPPSTTNTRLTSINCSPIHRFAWCRHAHRRIQVAAKAWWGPSPFVTPTFVSMFIKTNCPTQPATTTKPNQPSAKCVCVNQNKMCVCACVNVQRCVCV